MDYRFISRWWITVIFIIFCKTFVIFFHYRCLTKFDRCHWLLRPQEGGGPLLLPPRSLQGPPSQPGPLTGDPSASSTHGFSSSNRRSQWCHTKVGPCPVIGLVNPLTCQARPAWIPGWVARSRLACPLSSPPLLHLFPWWHPTITR